MLKEVRKRENGDILLKSSIFCICQIEKDELLCWPPFQTDKIAKYIYIYEIIYISYILYEISAEISKVQLLPWTNNLVNVSKSIISQNSEEFFCI